MVAIPPKPNMTPEQAFARLQVWYGTQQQAAELRTAEVLERKTLASYYFPEPVEGTNRLPLGGGFDLKMGHSITRKVDEAALENVKVAQARKLKLNLDELFPSKPSLNLTAYRKLNDDQRAFVDTLLDIKVSDTPSLHIVPQADTAGAAAHKAAAEAMAGNAGAPPSPEAGSSAGEVVHAYTIVEDAEQAQPGHYYTDGEGNWWCLSDDVEWEGVEDAELVASLEAQVAVVEDPPPEPEKPARKRRARKTAKAGEA